MTDKPDLSIVPDPAPDPTADFMAALGATTIAGVLGSYQANLDERDRLLHELLQQEVQSTELLKAYALVQGRLGLYQLLGHEVSR